MLEKKKKKSFSIFMPKLTEHNSTNQDPYSNQDCLSKYRNLKGIQSVKLKIKYAVQAVTKNQP
uniref:Uncharacterized protein n=1 Tax=Theropithecus gelada TaxID=9565 RepID=A0A8D2JYM4_THEGE